MFIVFVQRKDVLASEHGHTGMELLGAYPTREDATRGVQEDAKATAHSPHPVANIGPAMERSIASRFYFMVEGQMVIGHGGEMVGSWTPLKQ